MRGVTQSRRGRRLIAFFIAVLIAGAGVAAWAYLTAGATAGSAGHSQAATVNQGATPTASAVGGVGREVSVSWGASTLSNGTAVDGYLVNRYPASGGSATVSPVGTCAGTVTGTSCTEDDVPAGSWKYTVTPVIGTHWQGQESLLSGTVTIAPAVLTVNGSPFGNATFTGNPATATTTGSVTGFAKNEGVSYRLDSSTSLSGSPTSVGTNGNATITSLGIPKNAGDGSHTVYALGDASYLPSQASAGIVIDTVAPTVSASLSPAANGAGWNNSSPVSVTLAANDGTGSGIQSVKYTTDSSDPTTSGTAQTYVSPFNISVSGTTTVKYYATDVAGNASSVQTQLVKIDTVAPTNSLSLNVTSGNALLSGSTLWYRGVAAGSFTIANAVSDTLSGPASSATSALSGDTSGWSHSSSLVSTPANGPYVSNAFSWGAGTTSSPNESVTGRDVADNFTTGALAFTNDSTGPSGGSVDANGLVGTGSRYSTSTTLSIIFATGTDSGVGLAASGFLLKRESGTLSSSAGLADGSCDYSAGSFSTIATDPIGSYTDNATGGISTGHCYKYQYVVTDKLGNSTTYTSGDIKVDTTGPSAPTAIPSGATGNTFINGTTVFINPQAGFSGSFTASATTTDADSGILKVNFPTLSGFTGGSGDDTTSPYSSGTYNWSGASATASGSQTVTAFNHASLTNIGAFIVAPDTAAPAGGGVVTVNGQSATGVGTAGYSSSTNFTIGTRTDYTDSGSGIASSVLTVQSFTLSSSDGIANGTCGAASAPFSTPTTISGTTQPGGIVTGRCYLYTLTGTDNVGNMASVSTTVKVDTSVPSGPSVSLSGATGNTFINGTAVFINPQAGKSGSFSASATSIDTDSGILKINFPALTGFTSGGGDDTSLPYSSGTYTWSGAVGATGSQTVTSTNNASLTNTGTFTVTPDTTAPSGGSASVTGLGGTGSLYSTSTTLSIALAKGTDTGSGLGATGAQLLRASATLSAGTCGTFGSFSQVGSNDPTTPYTDNAAGGITTGNCYRYQYLVPDNVGNVVTYTSGDVKVDTTAPTFVITDSAATLFTNGTNVVYFKGPNGTTFTITASDAESGVTPATFGSTTDTKWTKSTTSTSATWSLNGANSDSTISSSTATNNAGATGTLPSVSLIFDNTVPTNSLSLAASPAPVGAFLSGTTLYFKSNAAGSFSLVDTVTDAESGAASATFAANTTAGWTFNSGVAQTVSTPVGGPFTFATTSWTSGATAPSNKNVTSLDNVTNSSGNTSVSFVADILAPTTAITFPTAASYNAGGWTGAITGTATDTGSGLATVNVSIKDTTNNTCADATGAFTVTSCTTNFVAPTGTASWSFAEAASNLTDGHSYTVTVQTIDNVGNTNNAADTATWTYDTTAATATITSPSNAVNYTSTTWAALGNPPFKGTAADATSGVSAVAMSIHRNDTNQCLNALNANASWVTCPDAGATAKFIAVTGTTSWTSANETFAQISTGLPAATTTQLTMVVRTTDVTGNVSNAAASITFGITKP